MLGSPKKIEETDCKLLTEREKEVFKLLTEGFCVEEVSQKLFVSPKTVKNHCAGIMGRLNLHSHYERLRYAAKVGLLDVDLWKT